MHEGEAFRDERREGPGRSRIRGVEGDDVGPVGPTGPLDRKDAFQGLALSVDLVVLLLKGAVPRYRVPNRVPLQKRPDRLAFLDAVWGHGPDDARGSEKDYRGKAE